MNDYEYEYDPSVEPANGTGDDSRYTGFSAYQQPAIKKRQEEYPLLTPSEDLDKFNNMNTQYSTEVYTSHDLDHVLQNWDRFDRVVIRSWDLSGDPLQTGTIVRFENRRTNIRSIDFRFTIMRKSFQRNLKPNMDRVREEVDAELSQLDAHALGGIQRYSGATKDGTIQMIISTIGNDFHYAYLCMADQLVIPIVNKWNLSANCDSLVLQQALAEIRSPEEIVQQLRGF